MSRQFTRWFATLAAAATMGAAACGGNPAPAPGSASPGRLLPASPTALPTFDATAFRQLLGQLRGKPVVVNIWASWCGPCIEEAPELARVAMAYAGRVQFLGVDIQDQLPLARAFIERYGWPYPSVFDPTGAIRDSLGLIGQPQTVFFDESGAQVCVWSGPTSEKVLTDTLESVLGASGASPCPEG